MYEGVESYSWHACGRTKRWGIHDGLRPEMVSSVVIDKSGVTIDTCAFQGYQRTRDHRVSLSGEALIGVTCAYLREADAFENLCRALSAEDQARLAQALSLLRAQLVDTASDGAAIAELLDQMRLILRKMGARE